MCNSAIFLFKSAVGSPPSDAGWNAAAKAKVVLFYASRSSSRESTQSVHLRFQEEYQDEIRLCAERRLLPSLKPRARSHASHVESLPTKWESNNFFEFFSLAERRPKFSKKYEASTPVKLGRVRRLRPAKQGTLHVERIPHLYRSEYFALRAAAGRASSTARSSFSKGSGAEVSSTLRGNSRTTARYGTPRSSSDGRSRDVGAKGLPTSL